MLPIADANVILRYLLQDDTEQFEIAKRAVEDGCEATVEVLAEVVYVLQGRYGVPRGKIAESLGDLLESIHVERQDEMEQALAIYAETSLDLIDCILAAMHEISGRDVITFDKKLNRALQKDGGH